MTLGRGAHPHFQAVEPAFVRTQFPWSARLEMERHYPPTLVVPIYLLTFLHAFKLLAWQELEQAMGAHSIAWIQTADLTTLQPRGFAV